MTGIFWPLIARFTNSKGEQKMQQQELFHPVPECIDPDEIKERALSIALELEGVPAADALRVIALALARFSLGHETTRSAKEAAIHTIDDGADAACEVIREGSR
jgi:hypothetical protein